MEKKTIIAVIALVAMLISAGIIYPEVFAVTDVNRIDDVVTIENLNGYTYTFYECEDWDVGDMCICIMYSNCTDSITDDEIMCNYFAGTFTQYIQHFGSTLFN